MISVQALPDYFWTFQMVATNIRAIHQQSRLALGPETAANADVATAVLIRAAVSQEGRMRGTKRLRKDLSRICRLRSLVGGMNYP